MPQGFFLPGGEPKLGLTTPASGGKAVRRNRIKRIMRETYRLNRDKFPPQGSLLYLVKRTDLEEIVPDEMIALAARTFQRSRQTASKPDER